MDAAQAAAAWWVQAIMNPKFDNGGRRVIDMLRAWYYQERTRPRMLG